jgi:tetratricopeptide (TPR) repeat protein
MEAVDLGTENDERMARLREALALGAGFQLVIIQVEPGEQREEVLRRLAGWSERNGVPRLELVRLLPGESPIMRLVGEHAGVILVGLEPEPDGKHERPRQVIAELNWSRDRLPELVHGPLVLVVSQQVQTALFEQAPDFYSWRAHSTSIASVARPPYALGRHLRRFESEPEDPAGLEAMIATTASLRPPVLLELGHLYARLVRARLVRSEFLEAEAAFDAAHDAYARVGTTDDRVGLLLVRRDIAEGRGRFEEASAWRDKAQQEAASGSMSPRGTAHMLFAEALHAFGRGNPEAAAAELSRALAAFHALGDHVMESVLLVTRVGLGLYSGGIREKASLLEQALTVVRRAGDASAEAGVLRLLALDAVAAGRSDDAEQYGLDAVARAEASGSVEEIALARAALGQIAVDNDHLELAESVLGGEVAAVTLHSSGTLA